MRVDYYKGLRILGTIFILGGCLLVLRAVSPTGFVLLESIEQGASSFLGLILVTIGIVLVVVGRLRRAGLAALVATVQPIAEEHHQAHNVANYHRMITDLKQQDIQTKTQEEHEKNSRELLHKYGSPENALKEGSVTLYHAVPLHKGFSMNPHHLIDEKKLKGGGFFMAPNALSAREELPGYAPTDVKIIRFEIPKTLSRDLELEEQTSHINAEHSYKLPKRKVSLFNDLYEAGYIRTRAA
jgi:hypothetical protein